MKRFNYEQHLENISKKYRTSIVVLVLNIVLFVGSFIIGLLISTYENKAMIMTIFSVILAILIIGIGVNLFGFFLIYKKDIRQIYYILGGYLTNVSGVLSENKGVITTITGRKVIELILKNEDEEVSIYFDPIFGENPFVVGETLNVKLSESFIIQYEVKHE